MLRKTFLILIPLCQSLNSASAQENLILNGDFEFYSECPGYENGLYDLNKAFPWFNPTHNTPDYFNVCDSLVPTYTGAGVPDNFEGSQYAHSGYGYSGMALRYGTENGREYLSVPLTKQLIQGNKYALTYYTVLSKYSQAAIGSIGVYFSNESIKGDTTFHVLNLIPQMQHPVDSFLIDTINWIKISGSYIAQGSEKYVTIGNFNDNTFTPIFAFTYVPNEAYNVYYYIDDVSLYEVDTSPTDTTHPPPVDTIPKPLIIPNLLSAAENPNWQFINLQQGTRVTIYNILGQLLYQSLDYQNDFPVNELVTGLYFYIVTSSKGKEQKGKMIAVR